MLFGFGFADMMGWLLFSAVCRRRSGFIGADKLVGSRAVGYTTGKGKNACGEENCFPSTRFLMKQIYETLAEKRIAAVDFKSLKKIKYPYETTKASLDVLKSACARVVKGGTEEWTRKDVMSDSLLIMTSSSQHVYDRCFDYTAAWVAGSLNADIVPMDWTHFFDKDSEKSLTLVGGEYRFLGENEIGCSSSGDKVSVIKSGMSALPIEIVRAMTLNGRSVKSSDSKMLTPIHDGGIYGTLMSEISLPVSTKERMMSIVRKREKEKAPCIFYVKDFLELIDTPSILELFTGVAAYAKKKKIPLLFLTGLHMGRLGCEDVKTSHEYLAKNLLPRLCPEIRAPGAFPAHNIVNLNQPIDPKERDPGKEGSSQDRDWMAHFHNHRLFSFFMKNQSIEYALEESVDEPKFDKEICMKSASTIVNMCIGSERWTGDASIPPSLLLSCYQTVSMYEKEISKEDADREKRLALLAEDEDEDESDMFSAESFEGPAFFPFGGISGTKRSTIRTSF